GPALMPGSARDHPIETPVRSTDSMIGMATASNTNSDTPRLATSDQMLMAMPSKASLPNGWKYGQSKTQQDEEAFQLCQKETETNCAGFAVGGGARFWRSADDSSSNEESSVKFVLYSFDTPESARVAMKGMAVKERSDRAKPLTIDAGAEEGEAFGKTRTSWMIMRVGGVVVRVEGIALEGSGELEELSRLQVSRIKAAASGTNPDA
ncbi:hypothetical protein ACIOHO_37365, partial [Streptomyces sp. NPDC087849]|uniref:hypothetical protein n=1 Tax=Streptomyces sp. NPDC087849 TaxID=3365808 RepID=UPI00381156D9